jgi:predicted ribosomally synthesized peptide with nif11-like leader
MTLEVILMSMESAKSFIERMKTDEEFAKQVSEHKDKEARMGFAIEQGYDFTGEEVREAATQLTEDELQQIVGGLNNGDICCVERWWGPE